MANDYVFACDSTGWNTEIYNANKVVRYMNVGTSTTQNPANSLKMPGDTLYTDGHTLYNQDEPTGKGLGLAENCKFVVVQDENGKEDVQSVHSTIKSALTRLANCDTGSTSGTTKKFNGTICAVLNKAGEAVWVVFDSNSGYLPDTNIVEEMQFDIPDISTIIRTEPKTSASQNGNVIDIYVPLIDVAGSDIPTEVNTEVDATLSKMGYTLTGTINTGTTEDGAVHPCTAVTAWSNDGSGLAKVKVSFQNFVSLKVNDGTTTKTVEYVPYNGRPFTTDTDISGTGTGYVLSSSYTAYTATDTRLAGSYTAVRTYETGYVDITAMDMMTTEVNDVGNASALNAGNVTTAKTSPASAVKYAKVGSNVTVTTTVAANTTPGATVDVTFTYTETLKDGTATVKTCADTWTVPNVATGSSGITHVFNIPNVQGDISAANAIVKEHLEPHAINVSFSGGSGSDNNQLNGMTATVATVTPKKPGEMVVVEMTIDLTTPGPQPTDDVKFTVTGGTNAKWKTNDVTNAGCSLGGPPHILVVPADALLDGPITLRITYTAGANAGVDAITIALANNP